MTHIYKYFPRHRLTIDIFSQRVGLYFRFRLSYGNAEILMAQKGVTHTHEPLWNFLDEYEREYAERFKRRRQLCRDTHDPSKVSLKIDDGDENLWRTSCENGGTLDILAKSRRDLRAANRFLKKVFKTALAESRHCVPNKLGNYGARLRSLTANLKHVSNHYLDKRPKNLTYQRESMSSGDEDFGHPVKRRYFLPRCRSFQSTLANAAMS